MKKIITTSILAVAALAISAQANMKVPIESEKLSDYLSAEEVDRNKMVEQHTESLDVVSKSVGRFYEKGGMALSYTKILNLDLTDTVNLTTIEAEIGYNGAVFVDTELKNKTYLFSREDSIFSGLSVIQVAKYGSFAGNVKKTVNVEKQDEFGNFIPNSTEEIKVEKRFNKLAAGLGFGIEDTLFLSGTQAEFTFAKGFGLDVVSETDFKVLTPLYLYPHVLSSLEVGVRYTRTDDVDFNSASIKVNFAF